MIPQITIPYAVADFAEICERGFCYVDKTRFIPYLERIRLRCFCVRGVLEELVGLYARPLLRSQ